MRICVICEGSYPYVPGGVSSWLHGLMQSMPQHEFVIWAIAAQSKMRGQYAYQLPANVHQLTDVYLDDAARQTLERKQNWRLNEWQAQAFKELLGCREPDWPQIFDMMSERGNQSIGFLQSELFLSMTEEICTRDFPHVGFTDYFWTVRSMFLPLLFLLGGEVPQADLYHAVSAGYAGVLGAMAAHRYQKPFVLTEHGIYTREREEEILRTNWVPAHFKELWIHLFYMLSRCAYQSAEKVTALFHRANILQQELGCPGYKCTVIANGVHHERFADIGPKPENGWIDIGAVVRLVPIKDIKTMIYAFSLVRSLRQNVRLHIMGPVDEDPEYYLECQQLIADLAVPDITFTDRINVREYLPRMDFTLLTSISEGQPLAVMESLAAGRPVVSTDVGSCRELLEGAGDDFGSAGLLVPVMHQSALAEAMLELIEHPEMRQKMGANGRRRIQSLYGHDRMIRRYQDVFDEAIRIKSGRQG